VLGLRAGLLDVVIRLMAGAPVRPASVTTETPV